MAPALGIPISGSLLAPPGEGNRAGRQPGPSAPPPHRVTGSFSGFVGSAPKVSTCGGLQVSDKAVAAAGAPSGLNSEQEDAWDPGPHAV